MNNTFTCASRIFPFLVIYITVTGDVAASGLTLYEISTPDTGYASAGSAARANDPTTIATNPAGLTRLKNDELMVGGQVLYGNIQFIDDGKSTTSGGNGDNAVGLLPGASIFYSHQIDDVWTAGFGIYSNFGLSIDYGDSWSGRYDLQKGTLIGATIAPTLAYQLDEHWSIGTGLNIMYSMVKADKAVPSLEGQQDGAFHTEDHDWGTGVNIGVLYQQDQHTRIGVDYNSPIKLKFTSPLELSPGGVLTRQYLLPFSGDITVPQSLNLSAYHDLSEQWAILGSLGWQDWSEFGEISGEVNNTGYEINEQFDDGWHAALGFQYQLNPEQLLTFGVAYDSSIIDDKQRTVALPLAEQWRLGVGWQQAITENALLNISYDIVFMPDMPVYQVNNYGAVLSGTYKNPKFQFLSANFTWKF
ncbi:TPA: transporter [Raoultella planticola]|nr:transporter [Raoultella planticola]HAT1648188.1 transporter [Raoultella planticola]